MRDTFSNTAFGRTQSQWRNALKRATAELKLLVAQPDSRAWKPVPYAQTRANINTASTAPALPPSTIDKGKQRDAPSIASTAAIDARGFTSSTEVGVVPCRLGSVEVQNVAVHRRSIHGKDMYRAVTHVPFDGQASIDGLRAVLQTPQTIPMWDSLVEDSEVIEVLDSQTRVSRTKYRLGWPSSPRDTITISRTTVEDTAVIDVATSLPRSPDAPAYLRPAPPYVRSHLHLFAWHIELPDQSEARSINSSHTLTVTAYWSWDLKGAWLGMPTGGLGHQLPLLVCGFVDYTREHAAHIPAILDYGNGVEVTEQHFDPTRDQLGVEYTVVAEDPYLRDTEDRSEKDLEGLQRLRENRKSTGCMEVALSCEVGWDVKILAKSIGSANHQNEWTASVEHSPGAQSMVMRLRHSRLERLDDSVRVKLQVQRVTASSGVRINDLLQTVERSEPRTVPSFPDRFLDDAISVSGLSISSSASDAEKGSPSDGSATPAMAHVLSARSSAITALVRRNYIYFTSLLQEPEAKWKPVNDLRGVTVTQLDSIDPTLVVYRAEATFVGVSVWDLYSCISSPGVRAFWEKSLEEAHLVEDVNELSSLWQFKTKAAWPVAARDSVIVQTAYKSPASVHIFGFSTDDRSLFPSIPRSSGTGTIRTQVDLRGWSVEALSPTTAHITLLEQSDPKGWTSKTAIPSAMIAAVAGVGDYAIRFGGPPVTTRLLGARATVAKYDHEKATYRFEYTRNDALSQDVGNSTSSVEEPHVECELRCDIEVWSSSLDLVIDPPPIHVSCLRRHKLAAGGGGLWITIEHVAASLEDDNARVTVRKGQGSSEKGSVCVNGAKMHIDVDEMKDQEREDLVKKKRTKPLRIPLDLNSPARRRGTIEASNSADSGTGSAPHSSSPPFTPTAESSSQVSSSSAKSQITSATGNGASGLPSQKTSSTALHEFFSDESPRQPMTCALDVLFLLRRLYAERSPDPAGTPAGWALVSERNGLFIRRKLMQSISTTILVQRGDKVVQGLSAEDLVNTVSSLGCRRIWDDKVDSATTLESFGDGASTSCFTTKASFPFRGRIFHVASLTTRASPQNSSSGTGDVAASASDSYSPAVFFHATASFNANKVAFPSSRLNPTSLPVGKVLIDGWILETLDPYASTSFQIPSTRCTHVVAYDFGGSIPATVNTLWNTTLPRSIIAVEEFVKKRGVLPALRFPPSWIQVLGDGRDEDHEMGWVLDESNRGSTVLESAFSPMDRTLNVLTLVEPRTASAAAEENVRASGMYSALVSDASTTRGAAQAASASALSARLSGLGEVRTSSPSLTGRERDLSAAAARRATSVTSLSGISHSSTSTAQSVIRARPSAIRRSDLNKKARQAVLVEVEVELKHYADGYEIDVVSELLDEPIKANADATNAQGQRNTASASTVLASSSLPSSSTMTRSHLLPLDNLTTSSQSRDLPVQVSVHDLPPSAVLAATLDPAARPRRHLVRIYLPSNAQTDAATDLDTQPLHESADAVPSWLSRLRSNGALVKLIIRPRGGSQSTGNLNASSASAEMVKSGSATSLSSLNAIAKESSSTSFPSIAKVAGDASSDDSDSGDEGSEGSRRVEVRYEGRKLAVMHVNQTSAMLQRESGVTNQVAKLRRALPSTPMAQSAPSVNVNDDLPTSLRTPIAAMLGLKEELRPSRANGAATTAADALAAVSASAAGGSRLRSGNSTPRKDGGKGAVKGSETPSDQQPSVGDHLGSNGIADKRGNSKNNRSIGTGSSAPKPSSQSLSSPIFNILGAYPLARLSSASTAVTNAFAGSVADPDAASSGVKVEKVNGIGTDNLDGTPDAEAGVRARDGYRLQTVLLVALVAFLLGSLVRGFAAPADFVLMPSGKTMRFDAEHTDRLGQALAEQNSALNQLQNLLGKDASDTWNKAIGSSDAGTQGGLADDGQPQVAWRELRRLLELRGVWRGWDIVLAVVRR